jgi:hypothetical protein
MFDFLRKLKSPSLFVYRETEPGVFESGEVLEHLQLPHPSDMSVAISFWKIAWEDETTLWPAHWFQWDPVLENSVCHRFYDSELSRHALPHEQVLPASGRQTGGV